MTDNDIDIDIDIDEHCLSGTWIKTLLYTSSNRVEHSTSDHSTINNGQDILRVLHQKHTDSKQTVLPKVPIIAKTEALIKNMRWRALFYLNPPTKQSKKETFGFESTRTPPAIEEMKVF